MEQEYQPARKLDVNEIIIRQRPKFVYALDYPNLMATRMYGERKYIQTFIPQIIQTLYKPTMFEHLVELK